MTANRLGTSRSFRLVALLGLFTAAALAHSPAALAQARGSAEARSASAEDNFTGNYLAGRTASAERDTEGAANYFSRALRSDPANVDLLTRSFIYRINNGDVEMSMPLATRLLAQDKTNELARMVLGVKSIKDKAFTAAKTNLSLNERSAVGKLTAGLMLAWASQGLGDTDGALAVIASMTGQPWYEIYKNYDRALIADAAGRKADAVKFMKDAFDADNTAARMTQSYARILARGGNSVAAQKVLLDYVQRSGEDPIVSDLLKEIGSGKTPTPMAANAAEGSAEMLYSLALALNTEGGEQLSTLYLQLALYLNPNADLARLALGSIFQNTEDTAKAVAVLRGMAETSPLHPSAVVEVALNLDTQKQTDEAISQLRKLLDKSPGNIDAGIALGEIYRSHKRYEEAANTFSASIATIKSPGKSDWRIFYFRAIAYERGKHWPLAEADFKKALELFPDQPQVLNYLGYSWVDMGMNLDDGLAMIKKAVDLRPDDGYIVDSLGWAYYRLGRYNEAVSELERAVQLKAADSTINDHLGDAYWRIGRKLEATFQWAHARDLQPEPEDLAVILKKLSAGLPANASNKG